MQRLVSILVLGFALAVLGGGGWLWYSGQQVKEDRRFDDGPVPVDVVNVGKQIFSDRIEALGTAVAKQSVTITARVSEPVTDIRFEDGDFVKQGDILVELDAKEEAALLDAARAVVHEAELQLERTRQLIAGGNATRVTLDEQVRILDSARAQLAAAQARANDRVIRAPFSGVLGLRQISTGALVTPGMVITTLDDVFPILVDFAVPERFLSALKPGQQVNARAAAWPGEVFGGKVLTVSTRIDPVTRAVTVRAELPNEDARLRPGMLMTIEVISRERLALYVPEEAIVQVAREHFVYVVDSDDMARRRTVDIGVRRPGTVEIVSGLVEGDTVVVAGTARLKDVSPVKIMDRGVPVPRSQA